MEITAEINYGNPLSVTCLDSTITLKRQDHEICLEYDEMNDIVQLCKMLKWEDFS